MTGGDADLLECETVISNESELQWRQVKGTYLDRETCAVLEMAFQANGYVVSTSRSSVVDAKAAMEAHLANGRDSMGTWAVSVAEVSSLGCRVIDDQACDEVETPGHSYIDMRSLGNKGLRRAVRVELATFATTRGRQHPPSSTT